MAVWDDHDFGADDAGAEYPRKAESQQIFLDFFGVPRDSPRRKQEGVYSAAMYGPTGKQVQVILLDTRYFRSPLRKKAKPPPRPEGPYEANTDPGATILGEAQWQWLEKQLAVPAQVRIIASSVQVVAEDHGYEKWMNFPRERERLFKLLKDTKAAGVVFLSGDRHLAELSMMDGGVGYPLYDLTSSGLNQGFKAWRPLETNRHRVATMNFGNNFGLVQIDWDAPPRLSLQIRDEEGAIMIQEKLALRVLQPGAAFRTSSNPDLAAEAARHVGKEYILEMAVASTGASKDAGFVFLNSEPDFKSPRNFTVVLDMKAIGDGFKKAGVADPAKHFAGKSIRVTGTVSLRQERPQIIVKDAKQVQPAEK
jgi:alkaline phosphatase D